MFWLQIAAEGIFCCYNNICNVSRALCAAETSAFEVNGEGKLCQFTTTFVGARHYMGKETVWCFQQFSPGAPVGWYTVSYNSLCSETSTICLPASFFLLLLLWKRIATHLSLVSWYFVRIFFFFLLEKTLWAAEKDAGCGVLKSTQDFFWKHGLLHRIIMWKMPSVYIAKAVFIWSKI